MAYERVKPTYCIGEHLYNGSCAHRLILENPVTDNRTPNINNSQTVRLIAAPYLGEIYVISDCKM